MSVNSHSVSNDPEPAFAPREWREAVRAEALAMGFEAAGFTGAEELDDTTVRRWRRWLDQDVAGSMTYLTRPHPRRTHPRDLLPESRSALVLLAGYHQGDHPGPPETARTAAPTRSTSSTSTSSTASTASTEGKIARYAWGEDYHAVLRARMERLGEFVRAGAAERGWPEPVASRPAVDSAPLDERALAARAGLGFIGKNTLLIRPGVGSWFLISVLLTSIPFEPDPPAGPRSKAPDEADREPARLRNILPADRAPAQTGGPHPDRTELPRNALPPEPWSCGSCRRCLDACPTGALTDAHRLDPRRCISYLTIESRGPIPAELAPHLEGWAFGCDACQEVCPFNAAPPPLRIPEFEAGRGAGAFFAPERLAETPSGKSFERRWAASPISRAGLKGMTRNLAALAPAAPPELGAKDAD